MGAVVLVVNEIEVIGDEVYWDVLVLLFLFY